MTSSAVSFLETSIDALYSRNETQVLDGLRTLQELWDETEPNERGALAETVARSTDRLTVGVGRVLLGGLEAPRAGLVHWLCACAAGPHLTAVTPGFLLALEAWGLGSAAVREVLVPLLDHEDAGLRGSAQQAVWKLSTSPFFRLPDGDDRIVAALWRGVGRGDWRAGAIVASHSLRFDPGRLGEVLAAPGRAPTGASFTLDRERILATPHLPALEPVLREVEKKGEKSAKEAVARLLARSWLVGGNVSELQRRLARGAKRPQTAVGLRYAAEDGVALGGVIPLLAELLTGASEPFLRWTAAEALAAAVRTGEVRDGPGWEALVAGRGDADARTAAACDVLSRS